MHFERIREVIKMAKSKLVKANEKIAENVVGGYKKIEDTVVNGYKKIEDTFVGGYKRIEDKFVDEFPDEGRGDGRGGQTAPRRRSGGAEREAESAGLIRPQISAPSGRKRRAPSAFVNITLTFGW